METERPHVVRQAIMYCRKGGTVSIPGVYGGLSDKIPMGALMNKGLTIKTAQQHGQRYAPRLLDLVQRGAVDPARVVTHVRPLSEAQEAYRLFKNKDQDCVRVLLRP
jgi:threonine dehydrogenase-like Zn-dependent dehydrogenase